MKVLMLHDRNSRQRAGDESFHAEVQLLRTRGVAVIDGASSIGGELSIGERWNAAWSAQAYESVLALCRKHQPDVAHVHNVFSRLSPSVHAACHAAGVPTVQTLYDFSSICAAGSLSRNEASPCHDCLGRGAWRAVVHRCANGSIIDSAAAARLVSLNHSRGTWRRDVDAFIVSSASLRKLFAAGGIPAERIFLRPCFAEDPGPAPAAPSACNDYLYAGPLSREGGVKTLLAAWATRPAQTPARLVLAGSGPDSAALRTEAEALGLSEAQVTFLGAVTVERLRSLMLTARAVVLPSTLYAAMPAAVVEAFACGRPALVSRLGPNEELVKDGVNGFTFPAGDAASMADAIALIAVSGELADRIGRGARVTYEQHHRADQAFAATMDLYQTLSGANTRTVPAPDEPSMVAVEH